MSLGKLGTNFLMKEMTKFGTKMGIQKDLQIVYGMLFCDTGVHLDAG